MPTPTVITDLSQTAASNYPAGTDSPSVLDDVQRAHAAFIALLRDGKGQTTVKTLAGGSTTDIGGENSLVIKVTGSPTITSLGTNYNGPRFLIFQGIVTLTHSATLVLPGAADITTAANDSLIAIPISGGWQVVAYQRSSGLPAIAGPLASTASGLTQATNRLLGRSTAGSGAIEELSLAATLELVAGVLGVKDSSVTGSKLSGAQSGSAPIFAARAWCQFNGTSAGTNAPTAGGNVTSVTRNSAGDYTINFTTAMADANYGTSLSYIPDTSLKNNADMRTIEVYTVAAGAVRIVTGARSSEGVPSALDFSNITVIVYR